MDLEATIKRGNKEMKIRCITRGADCNIRPSHVSQVKQQDHYIRTSEAEENTEGHFLTDFRKDATSLYFDENFEKGMEIDDVSSTFHYGLKSYRGGSDLNTAAEEKLLKRRRFDGMLHDDEVRNLGPEVGLPNTCEDYFLDPNVDLRKKVPELDYRFCEESGMEYLSESSSLGDADEAVEPSKSNMSELDHQSDQFKMIIPGKLQGRDSINSWTLPVDEMHVQRFNSFKNIDKKRSVARAEGGGEPYNWHGKNHNVVPFHYPGRISLVTRHVEPDDGNSSSQSEAEEEGTQDGSIGSFDEPRDVGALFRQKRTRLPPRRFIDESSHFHSQKARVKKETFVKAKKGKRLVVGSQNKQRKKESKMPQPFSYEASPGRSTRPVPFQGHHDFSVRYLPKKDYSMNRTTKKPASLTFTPITGLDSDSDEDEYAPSGSNSVKRTWKKTSYSKKRNKLWSVSEVEKLVDGISRFGVGKWTAIKRTFFATSRRTCLDIRDKWRNLLRASSSKHKGNTKDNSLGTEDGSQSLLKSLLERVRELASRHPFPRQGLKLPRTTKHDLCLPWPE